MVWVLAFLPGLSLITKVREHSRCAFLRPVRIEPQEVGRLVLGKIEGSASRAQRTGLVFQGLVLDSFLQQCRLNTSHDHDPEP